MQQPDQGQKAHPAVKNGDAVAPLLHGMGHHDGKADAEQQGKQAVKLAVNKHVLEEADHPVDSGGGHGGNNLRTLERVQGKLRKIRQADAEKRQSPQGV